MKININIKRTPQTLLSVKILSIVGFSFLLYLIVNLIYLRSASYRDVQTILKNQNDRIINDLIYKNGKWDTSEYVNDYQIAFNNPLYIITTDGFTIERETPIKGFLDTSDFKYSSSFSNPQTVTTPDNAVWRRYSRYILNKEGSAIGTVSIGYYQPNLNSLVDVDKMLTSNTDTIISQIKVKGNNLDVSSVDSRKVSVFLSFEIVDSVNNALISEGGLPAYIDRSYIPAQLNQQYKIVADSATAEKYIVYTSPFKVANNTIAIIASGYPLKQVDKDFQNQFIFSATTGAIDIIILIIFLGFLLQREITFLLKKASEAAQKVFYVSHRGGAFGFDQDTGLIYLGDKKMEVPVKTKQYYICKVLFSKPNKNWENDEIVDRLSSTGILEGSTAETADTYDAELDVDEMKKKARAIYDAVRLLNEKAKHVFGYEVVLLQGKTYRINPNIQPQNE